MSHTKAETLDELRHKIQKIQGFRIPSAGSVINFGVEAIDCCFPDKALPMAATHEFLSYTPESAAATKSFLSALLAKMGSGPAIWITKGRTLFPPALKSFGLYPEQFIFVSVSREQEALWAMEEALRCKGLLAVIGEISDADLTATRRLQIAIEASGNTGFLLRHNPKRNEASACASRWLITPALSEPSKKIGLGNLRWNVALNKVKNGQTGEWVIEWDKTFRAIEKPKSEHSNVISLAG